MAIVNSKVILTIRKENPRYVKKAGIEIDFKLNDTIVEAKFKREMDKKKKKLFESIRIKNKIIANGVDFFL